jgi:hypothetical protein
VLEERCALGHMSGTLSSESVRGSFLMTLPAHLGPWPLTLFRNNFSDGRTPWATARLVARPLPKHTTTETQNTRIQTPNIHAIGRIGTHDPSVRVSEDCSCLRPRGYYEFTVH